MTSRSVVVVTAGLGSPSSTRLLGEQLAAATVQALGEPVDVRVVEVRDLAHQLVDNALTGFPGTELRAALDAVAGADAVYTDVHESMGEPTDDAKKASLAPYKVTEAIMAVTRPGGVFMHCLPMRRGEEVEESVADGPRSIVFEQAEHRLHMHKALLLLTLG